jgi:TP901 family phage tail tape measure protein
MAKGVELATEWVTILPETAELVKKLKAFKPEPITIPVSIAAGGGNKSPEKQGQQLGKAIDKGVITATKNTGDKVGQNIAPASAPVQKAAQQAGKVIQAEVVKGSQEAGKKGGDAIASELEKAKSKVAAASQKLADARRAEENIGSRIRASEAKISQARSDAAKKAQQIASEEQRVANLRASAEENAATKIAVAERKIATMREQNERQLVRLSNMEEAHSRLQNTAATNAGRHASAAENMAAQEAALASAVAQSNKPLEDQEDQIKKNKGLMGGMAASLVPLAKQLLLTSGLFTGAMGVGGAITYVFKTGNEFTDTMNRMQGITQATGTEMQALNDKARALGRDFNLPATSANDAAMAMLELTKAGFTVQQAMDAARGSLQLSAAAGITAAEAAKITGTSLNAFGLQATDAGKVTDILANAANMFPGEMTDFGYSLSQAGAVAKSFGIDIEDTTTALGFLAKAGIKSSDAGTLIKTMLLSLTDQGKPAQKAIHTLGLELYDQQHKFKGIEYVYKRLNQASKEMTQEQYQQATATLFGTDAARFSGLAAGEAAPNWDEFRAKIDQSGTAAKVAEARMRGLPGALSRLGNALQSIGLTIYDSIKGPIEGVINGIAAVILKFDEWLNGPIKQWLKDHKDEIMGFAAVYGTYAAILGTVKVATAAWTAVQWLLNAALDANPIGLAVLAIASLVAGVIYAYKHFDWFKNAVDGAWKFIKKAWAAAPGFFSAVWNGIKDAASTAWGFIKPIFDTIGTVAMWLWHNVFVPVGQGIIASWKLLWTELQVAWAIGKALFDVIGEVAMWLWHTIFEPVWEGIKIGAQALWGFLQEVFEGWKIAFTAIGDAAMWLWHNVMEPVWEGIKSAISTVWDWFQPIIQLFKDAFKGIGDVGSAAGKGIHDAFSGLVGVIKAPIHALGTLLAGIPDEFLGVHLTFAGDIREWGKSLQNLALGGVISGPGTGTSDSIMAVNQSGIPTARVSNGEGVVPAKSLATPMGRAMFNTLLGMRTGGFMAGNVSPDFGRGTGGSGGIGLPDWGPDTKWGPPPPEWFLKPIDPDDILFPDYMPPGERQRWLDQWGKKRKRIKKLGMPGFAEGGVIGQFMSSVTGRPYLMGGFGESFDCSGLVSAMVNVAMGRAWNQGPAGGSARTATAGEAAWLTSQGFVPGSGGPGTLRVGFHNGGPGGGHTAGTLPDGTNFESTTPGGVRFGSGASGANDSQFDEHYFLPRGPQVPGMKGSPGSIGASFMGNGSGGTGAFGPSGIYGGGEEGGSRVVDEKKVREARDRLEDRTKQLEVAKQRLQEYLEKQKSGKNVKQSTIDSATNQVEKFTREQGEAQADLAAAEQGTVPKNASRKRGSKGEASGSGQQDWGSVGKMIFSGFLESFGLDGSVFTNLFDTPNFKSAMAGVNFIGGLFGGGGEEGGGLSGSGLGSGFAGGSGNSMGGLGNIGGGDPFGDIAGGLIAGIGDQVGVDIAPNGGAGDAGVAGVNGGPQFNQDFSGASFGYSRKEMEGYMDGKQDGIARRFPSLVAGGA